VQELDGLVFFASEPPAGSGTITKFGIDDPALLGQFPAASLMFRRGDVRPGGTSARLEHPLPVLFDLDRATPERPSPLAFLEGPVDVTFEQASAPARTGRASQQKERRGTSSSSGELTWDFREGVFTVVTPRAEAVTGFLSRAPVELGQLRLDLALDYAAVFLVALDDRPLSTSKRMLLQVMSEVRSDGFSTTGEPKRTIEDLGRPPLVVKRIEGSVTLLRQGGGPMEVQALDFNGYPYRTASGDGRRLPLLPEALHYVLTVGER
jgi:hypothetical protein